MKYSIITIILLLFVNSTLSQYYNNTYGFNDKREFNREIHLLENNHIIQVGTATPDYSNTSGPLIRELDTNGNLLWTDVITTDSIAFTNTWIHTSVVLDTILFLIATAYEPELDQDRNRPIYPYFMKYNLAQQQLIDLKYYPYTTELAISSTVFHKDGFLYGVGHEYLDKDYRNRDMLIMKFDLDGKLIWEKNFNFGPTVNVLYEIESFYNNLIVTGYIDADAPKSIIAKIDTTGELIEKQVLTPCTGAGLPVEIYKNNIYFTTTSSIQSEEFGTQYLAKLDKDLNVKWDTLIPNTSRYDINCRSMEILNDEIIMAHNIRKADEFTNNRDWSYASSWSIEGIFNWEHVYFYDSVYIHHLDDIEATPDGDLIFMGTVFDREVDDNTTDQYLWLFKTDVNGCGLVLDSCKYTLDRYFGIDTTVHIVESYLESISPISILGNPFNNQLFINRTNLLSESLNIKVVGVNGQVLFNSSLSNKNFIDTKNWSDGIYFTYILKENQVVWFEKIVKQ